MSIESILEAIDFEISRLRSAKTLLSGISTTKRKVGRPAKAVTGIPAIPAVARKKTRRTLSPEARKRIADAQRLRWNKQKSAAKAA